MKEFDLEKAKAGAPVCTRCGRPARVVCWDGRGGDMPILSLVTTNDGCELAYWYNEKGESNCVENLMMAPVKHEGWVNINPAGKYCFSTIFDTQEEAEARASSATIDHVTVHIEWEE